MNEVQEAMKERYAHIHPLIFQRSLERSKNDSELFDILETIPDEFPIVWDDEKRSWVTTEDLIQSEFGKKVE
jgi:hypothetical protein